MEKQVNLVENLNTLEKKIADLVHAYRCKCMEASDLLMRVCELDEELKRATDKIELLETSMLKGSEESSQEKVLTKMVVDSIIQTIDSAVESESNM